MASLSSFPITPWKMSGKPCRDASGSRRQSFLKRDFSFNNKTRFVINVVALSSVAVYGLFQSSENVYYMAYDSNNNKQFSNLVLHFHKVWGFSCRGFTNKNGQNQCLVSSFSQCFVVYRDVFRSKKKEKKNKLNVLAATPFWEGVPSCSTYPAPTGRQTPAVHSRRRAHWGSSGWQDET